MDPCFPKMMTTIVPPRVARVAPAVAAAMVAWTFKVSAHKALRPPVSARCLPTLVIANKEDEEGNEETSKSTRQRLIRLLLIRVARTTRPQPRAH